MLSTLNYETNLSSPLEVGGSISGSVAGSVHLVSSKPFAGIGHTRPGRALTRNVETGSRSSESSFPLRT